MTDLQQIVEWRKHYKKSVYALQIELIVLVVLGLLWLGLSTMTSVPGWLVVIVGSVQVFSIANDGLNVLSLRRKLCKEGW